MLTLIVILIMMFVFGKFFFLALRGAWGITKFLFALVLFPIFLIGLVLKGLAVIALPVLIVAVVAAMITEAH